MSAPLSAAKTEIIPFETSPFPYRGLIPGQNKPFLDVNDGQRRGHTSPRGGVYWEDQTYSDRGVLLHAPRGFDPDRPLLIIVYLHGNQARLARDVRDRQQVPRQVTESGLNAVLVAPQFAVDALDSSAGRFWEPGMFAQFMTEAAERLARLTGASPEAFARAGVVLVAYSGGYNPAASALSRNPTERIRGVILLDAMFGETETFAEWIPRRRGAFFVSAFTRAAQGENQTLQRLLRERQQAFQTDLPSRLTSQIVFVATKEDVAHNDFVTRAWVNDPVAALLRRIAGFARR